MLENELLYLFVYAKYWCSFNLGAGIRQEIENIHLLLEMYNK